jgi:transposase
MISKQGNSYLRALLVQAAWLLRHGNRRDPSHAGPKLSRNGAAR